MTVQDIVDVEVCTCNICKECLELKIQTLQEQPCICTYKTVVEQHPSLDENGNNIMVDVEVSVVDVMCARCIEIKGYQDTLDKWDMLDKANIDKEDYDKYDIVDGVICNKVIEEGKVSRVDELKTRLEIAENALLELMIQQMSVSI